MPNMNKTWLGKNIYGLPNRGLHKQYSTRHKGNMGATYIKKSGHMTRTNQWEARHMNTQTNHRAEQKPQDQILGLFDLMRCRKDRLPPDKSNELIRKFVRL